MKRVEEKEDEHKSEKKPDALVIPNISTDDSSGYLDAIIFVFVLIGSIFAGIYYLLKGVSKNSNDDVK